MTHIEIISGLTTPLPIVLATATPKPKAAIKLKKAAHATAKRGTIPLLKQLNSPSLKRW